MKAVPENNTKIRILIIAMKLLSTVIFIKHGNIFSAESILYFCDEDLFHLFVLGILSYYSNIWYVSL